MVEIAVGAAEERVKNGPEGMADMPGAVDNAIEESDAESGGSGADSESEGSDSGASSGTDGGSSRQDKAVSKAASAKKVKKSDKKNVDLTGKSGTVGSKDGQGSRNGVGDGAGKTGRKNKSLAQRAGLTFSTQKVKAFIKDSKVPFSVGPSSLVFITGIIEYMTYELMDLAAIKARAENRHRITPRHIAQAIREDQEFNELLRNVTLSNSGSCNSFTEANP